MRSERLLVSMKNYIGDAVMSEPMLAELDTVTGTTGTSTTSTGGTGVSRVKLVHANDSLLGCGSRRDRHETIGSGTIGTEPFRELLAHPALADGLAVPRA